MSTDEIARALAWLAGETDPFDLGQMSALADYARDIGAIPPDTDIGPAEARAVALAMPSADAGRAGLLPDPGPFFFGDSASIRPVHIRDANAFVAAHHGHNGPVLVARFCLGLFDREIPGEGETLVGVAIVGNPVARALCDGRTLEVRRLCLAADWAAPRANFASRLYGAACREARRRGFTRVVTYTLESEKAASVRGANFRPVAQVKPKPWDTRARRRRHQAVYEEPKVRWQWDSACRERPGDGARPHPRSKRASPAEPLACPTRTRRLMQGERDFGPALEIRPPAL